MKTLNILSTLLIYLLFTTPSLYAQGQIGDGEESPLQTQLRGTNMISCSSYDAINYNGHTVSEIDATEGNISDLSQLYGSPSSVNDDNAIIHAYVYLYGTNRVAFREGKLTRVDIKESNWPITVLGKTIRVGDSFSEMKQKFGDDLKIIYKPSIDADYSVSFGCSGNDGDGFLIDFSTTTNQVVEIVYFVNP
ncbi:hypothetical protein [Gracilimonas sediminicola]|uniref:Secreted protein n=1 Tax=Gracilimonas sediminicola TaxID=2952158 RepID=A0A9X2L395_9BACT|nr:hypothetical protein [Gracilimonas sediminicola]MCP9291472.1 hypothetical protein [Gracilimonas sediminicola]